MNVKFWLILFLGAGAVLSSFGNAGVFRGGGRTPVLEKSSQVQMVEEEVVMIPRRGNYPVDTSVRNQDLMDFRCRFLLRNLTDEEVTLQVGFPLSTDAVWIAAPEDLNQSELIHRFAFTAGTRKQVYPVRFVPHDRERKFSNLFLWEMTFAPREEIELLVNYTMGGYLGLGSTRRQKPGRLLSYRCPYLAVLTTGICQSQIYVTETGSSWAGEIEKAVFRYYPRDFEEYLTRRGAYEESDAGREKRRRARQDTPGKSSNLFSPAMPMIRIWSPEPEQWQPVPNEKRPWAEARELVYQPFRPQPGEPIVITYAFVCIPTDGEQFETLCQVVRAGLEQKIKRRERLKQQQPELYEKQKDRPLEPYSAAVRKNLADAVLEFYGIPRHNPEIADFLADQHWYPVREPRELDTDYRQLLLDAAGK